MASRTSRPSIDSCQCALAVAGSPTFIAFVAQHTGDQFANVAFVVDDQDFECHQLFFFVLGKAGEER
jgi:hypothetical protein